METSSIKTNYEQPVSSEEIKMKKVLAVPSKTFLRDLVEYHKDTEPELRRPLNFKKIKYIKKVAVPMKEYIERINTNDTIEDDIVIGGSAAAWTQVWGVRKPKDLDLYTKKMYQLKKDVIAILSRKYKNISSRAIIIKRDGTRVIQVMINNKPVVDIKSHIKTGTSINIFDKDIFYDFKSMSPLRIGNIFYVPVNELLVRKAQGINRYHYEKIERGEPPGDRVKKDLDDFFTISRSLDRSKGKKKKQSSGLTGLGTEAFF